MMRIAGNIAKKIVDYLRDIVNDELNAIDAFYREFA